MEKRDVLLLEMLLAEKRTSLAVLRTGAAVFTLAVSILAFLTATSHLYPLPAYSFWTIAAMCSLLLALGLYLVLHSSRKIRRYDKMIRNVEHDSPAFRSLENV
ncbi:MAG: hypothetical protein ACE5IB_05445 [Candidatus Geothermarchaeales archaeon]